MRSRCTTVSSAYDELIAQLRAIFCLHPNTLSQTHDLLGCRCTGSKADASDHDEAMEEEDEEELPPPPTFVSAAKAKLDPVKVGLASLACLLSGRLTDAQLARERVKLAALRDWAHVDCTASKSIKTIDDIPLRALVEASLPVSERRAASTDDEEEEAEEEKIDVKGGQVTFLFSRSATAQIEVEEASGDE